MSSSTSVLRASSRGYALVTSLIVAAVTTGLVIAFITQVSTEQKISRNDGDYSSAFYAAEAGLEKLNSDLSKLFAARLFPDQNDIGGIITSAHQPSLSGITFRQYSIYGGQATKLNGALNSSATTVTVLSTTGWPTSGFFMVDAEECSYTGKTSTTFTGVARGQTGSNAASHLTAAGVTRSKVSTLSEGDYSGLTAQMIPFTLQVTAQSTVGTEAKLTREVQAALIPVFQFGMFSDSDLSFFAGPDFTFNGRIHTNGHLFLTHFPAATLTLTDKVTAFKEVIRGLMANGNTGLTGTVMLKSGTSTSRALGATEQSYTPGVLPPAAAPTGRWSGWTNLSLTTYNGYLKNGLTGARELKLPFVADGYKNIELIRRPPADEGADSLMGESRLANQASLRVFISDTAAQLPGGVGYVLNNSLGSYSGTPFAEANPNDPDFYTVQNVDETTSAPLIGGYILIQRRNTDATWTDVTMEILGLGISTSDTNAILRFQKPRWDAVGSAASEFVPINMFDTQQGRFRNGQDSLSTTTMMRKLGIMNVIELNVGKLKDWFAGTIGATGATAFSNNGYIFYMSDRRGNRGAGGVETAELGFEDTVNPANINGDPNSTLDAGEDLNGNGVLDRYGANLPYSPYSASTDLYTTGVAASPAPFAAAINAINLTGALDASQTSIPVSSVADLTTGYYRIDSEIVNCTAVSSSPITCSRGQGGMTAASSATTATTHIPTAAIDLGAAVTSTATTFGVSSYSAASTNVTVPGFYRIDNETVQCTSKSANVLTCSRGKLGTTAAAHSPVKNWANVNITNATTSISVVSGSSFPTAASWYRIDNETSSCTRSTNTLTCTRGQLGTTAVTHSLTSINLGAAVSTTSTTTFTFASSVMGWSISGTSNMYRVDNEVIMCTSRPTATTLGCSRGQEGTTAATHTNGTAVQTRLEVRLVNFQPVNLFPSEVAAKNRVHYFRRSLRLVNGSSANVPMPGFTVASENTIYVLGNYNADGTANFADAHSHAAVIGDVVTLLSNAWANAGDDRSFRFPHDDTKRPATTSWYRMAIASGKAINFPKPSAEPDYYYGTDGGAHNFLRYLEDWLTTTQTSNYRGSIVSLYYMVQGVGQFKCCGSVYNPPVRAYAFDIEFLVPSQLPPGTPRFRDINNLAFRQTILAE